MISNNHLDPGPFLLPGGDTGVLLIHGFTGATTEMRPLGEYLNARGLTALAPLLPGHGTSVEDLHGRHWQEWAAATETALASLQARCRRVFVCGLSLGSLLTLHMAAHHDDLAGVIACSPAVHAADRRMFLLPVMKYVVRALPKSASTGADNPDLSDRLWCYDQDPLDAADEVMRLGFIVRRELPQVRCPLLVVYSLNDRTLAPDAGPYTYARAGTSAKEALRLERSGHVVTADNEWQTVAERIYAFIQRYSNGTGPHRSPDPA